MTLDEHYERCVDPDCPVAYAYRDPFPAVDHWHYRGPPAPEPSRWAELGDRGLDLRRALGGEERPDDGAQ